MRDDIEEFDSGGPTTRSGVSYRLYFRRANQPSPRSNFSKMSAASGGWLALTGNTANWVLEAAKKLEALARLLPGWDSYRGLSLNPKSRALTLDVLGWLSSLDELPTPGVVLGSGGDVHLEWRTKGRELEVDLGQGDSIAVVKVYPNGKIEEVEGRPNLPEELRGFTCWLMHDEQPPAP